MPKTILLIDMNAFFASVEQRCNPALRGKPIAVGGSLSTRSVVAAASYEARPFGIHSGMSMMEALRLCPSLIIVEGNPAKYVDTSMRVFRIFKDYTDEMEVYSIDECFLDVTPTQHLFGGPVEIAKAIKRRMKEKLGLTCSVGIAPNKMLAKLASGMQKPDGLTEIRPEQVKPLLENLPVEKLHGIGERTRIHLERLGIVTVGELGRFSRERLKREFGINGEILHEMGNGIDRSPIVPYHSEPDVKSMGHSYTLNRDTRDIDVVRHHLLRLSEMVGRRLREAHYAGRTVHLVLRYADRKGFGQQRSLIDYLDDGFEIYKTALSIFEEKKDHRAIRLVGVSVSSLAKDIRQLSLFSNPRQKDLLGALDAINDKYGEFTIKRASLVKVKVIPKSHGFDGRHLRQGGVLA